MFRIVLNDQPTSLQFLLFLIGQSCVDFHSPIAREASERLTTYEEIRASVFNAEIVQRIANATGWTVGNVVNAGI